MTDPTVFWPALLGLSFLIAGLITHRGRDFGIVFVAAALAAFAGEHFTLAASLATLVPKWLPGRLFIAYFVGVAHLAAAASFVTRRYVRWAALCLAIMFALFVLLMDLPSAIAHPAMHMRWSLAARETTFAIGALALFATEILVDRPQSAATLARVARMWTACVLVFYGFENLLYPQFSPGVPDVTPTAAWVPFPRAIAYVTGMLLVGFGITMFVRRHAVFGAAGAGLLMTLLTVALYVPQFFLANDAAQQLGALNFIFDTLLFAGTMLVIGTAISRTPALHNAYDGAGTEHV